MRPQFSAQDQIAAALHLTSDLVHCLRCGATWRPRLEESPAWTPSTALCGLP